MNHNKRTGCIFEIEIACLCSSSQRDGIQEFIYSFNGRDYIDSPRNNKKRLDFGDTLYGRISADSDNNIGNAGILF